MGRLTTREKSRKVAFVFLDFFRFFLCSERDQGRMGDFDDFIALLGKCARIVVAGCMGLFWALLGSLAWVTSGVDGFLGRFLSSQRRREPLLAVKLEPISLPIVSRVAPTHTFPQVMNREVGRPSNVAEARRWATLVPIRAMPMVDWDPYWRGDQDGVAEFYGGPYDAALVPTEAIEKPYNCYFGKPSKKWYAVSFGRCQGIWRTWVEVERCVIRVRNAKHKSFRR